MLRHSPRHKLRYSLIPVLLILVSACNSTLPRPDLDDLETQASSGLVVSSSVNRSNPQDLAGATVSGNIYVFTARTQGVSKVNFYLDDPSKAKGPYQAEYVAPFDLAGTSAGSKPNALDTTKLSDGKHDLLAVLHLPNGQLQDLRASFVVNNKSDSAKPPPPAPPAPPAAGGNVGPRTPHTPKSPSIFVSCRGSDGNAGRSASSPVKSFGKLQGMGVKAGDTIGLERGCEYPGKLVMNWQGSSNNPVTVTAYGSGALPVIKGGMDHAVELRGQHQIIEFVEVRQHADGLSKLGDLGGQAVGWRVGFFVPGSNNTIRFVEATGGTAGVHLTGSNNTVSDSKLYKNTIMSRATKGGDDDSGCWALVINGNDNKILHNLTYDNDGRSYDYGKEGAAFEIYKGARNTFLKNYVRDSTFAEIGSGGGAQPNDNRFEYNVYVPDSRHNGELLVVHGGGGFGGAKNAIFNHNTVYQANSGKGVIVWGEVSPNLEMRGNVIYGNGNVLNITAKNDKVRDNIFWSKNGRPHINGSQHIHSSNRVVDPQFVNAPSDLRLKGGSPAAGKGAYSNSQMAGN